MNQLLRKWLLISFLNLLLVALLGVLMRYKIAYSLPFIDQKHVLHSHSHFAFSGWVTQTFMVLLVHYLGLKKGESIFKKYNWLLYVNLFASYGMLISFILQGYAFFSISFSTLSIFVSYVFALFYWRDLNLLNEKKVSHLWFKAALVFNAVSSAGAFGLAYMMVNKIAVQNWYLASVYFFLHFQYNGWFLFAGMGLLVAKLEQSNTSVKKLRMAFGLFCVACVPAYLLSALWLPIPQLIYFIVVAAVVAQLAGWWLMVKELINCRLYISYNFSKYGKTLLLLSAIAFSIKLLLQTGSVHPALSQLSYGFRPIIIGYLHLVLLAVTSIFIFGYIISFEMVQSSKGLITGVFIFVAGIIINELLLMVQGVGGLSYTSIPHIDLLLLFAALILLTGIGIVFVACLRKPVAG